MKVSDYIFEFLKNKGIDQCFMLPGGGAMHLVDSLGNSGMPYVAFQHEQGAAIAAEAYGQHKNKPALLLTTSGPGATNAITGVTAGWIDSTPMFVISGQAKRTDLVGDKNVRQIGSQEVQIIPMVESITKYAVQIMDPNEIKYHLQRAYYEATTGRPGPVWLSIPLDVQGAIIEEDSLLEFVPETNDKTVPEDNIKAAVLQTVQLLKVSKKPLVLAGNGIKISESEELIYKFLEKTGIPVETTWKTIDMFDEEYAYYVGHPGIMGDIGANKILQEADLLISIGSRLDTSLTAFNDRHFGINAKKVIVDIDINEINRMDMDKEVSIACDAHKFLEDLLEECQDEEFDYLEWLNYCKTLRSNYPTVTPKHRDTGDYVSAYYFTEKLCELLKEDDVIVPESSGGAGEITYQAFKIKKGQKMKNAAGLGSMGFGLPYAIGSCIANDKRRTILINGDGAFQLNIQELETLKRLNLPVKMFIWCNDGYASIRSMQRNNYSGHYVASSEDSGFTVPDISKVAQAYGFKICSMVTNDEMLDIMPHIMKDAEPILCIVKVSPNETCWPRVRAVPQPDGSMRSGFLEEMS